MQRVTKNEGHAGNATNITGAADKNVLAHTDKSSTTHLKSQESCDPPQEKPEEPEWSFEDAELTLKRVDCDAGYATKRGIIEVAEDILLHNNFSDLEMDTIKSLIKQYLGLNKGALQKVVKAAQQEMADTPELTHSRIADLYITNHFPNRAEIVGVENCLWRYNGRTGLYEQLPLTNTECGVGKEFSGKNCQKGPDYKAIARLVFLKLFSENFFSEAPYGVAVKSSFIRIADNLSLVKEPYSPDHRQRVKLPVDPEKRDAPIFLQYLKDTFRGPNYKEEVALLQQIMGGLLIGCFRKLQRAILLIGSGSNGKSVLLELLEHMFPAEVKCAVSPSLFHKEYYSAQLAGRVINIVGELDETKPIRSAFKDVIGCDTPISARVIYKEPFSFKPKAGHIFASNYFPHTEDHSKGFYRRWVIIPFKNTVTDSKKIPNLGALIAEKELPQVLYWALQGAERLVKNKFVLPHTISHENALEKWKKLKDSVHCFLGDDEVVENVPGSRTPKKVAYNTYRNWCKDMGVKAVACNEFKERCSLKFREVKRSGGPRCFADMKLNEAFLRKF